MATTEIRVGDGRLSDAGFRLLAILIGGRQIQLTPITSELGMVKEVLGNGFAVQNGNVLKLAPDIDVALIE